jgi:hypothetical protein
MASTVRQVSRAPAIRELLGPTIRLADIETPKEMALVRPKYTMVIENGGEFANSILVPEPRPYFLPDEGLRSMVLTAADAVVNEFRPPVPPFKAIVVEVCKRFAFADGRWFVGAGGLVGEPTEAEIIRRVEQTHLPHIHPVPKELHPSQVDRTKVGWQLMSDQYIDPKGHPRYIRHVVVSTIRKAVLAVRHEYAFFVHDFPNDDKVPSMKATRANLEFVDDDFLNAIAGGHLIDMMKACDEGIPVNWEEYTF